MNTFSKVLLSPFQVFFKQTNKVIKGISTSLRKKETTGLLIIDLQEKILSKTIDSDTIRWNIRKIVEVFKILDKNIYATEQYPEKLGKTIDLGSIFNTYSKRSFSCIESRQLLKNLKKDSVNKLIICGIETHVCILQSCLDLIDYGFNIHLLVDATGSRHTKDHEVAIKRLGNEGVTLTTTETVIFELCKTSTNTCFKEISAIIKRSKP